MPLCESVWIRARTTERRRERISEMKRDEERVKEKRGRVAGGSSDLAILMKEKCVLALVSLQGSTANSRDTYASIFRVRQSQILVIHTHTNCYFQSTRLLWKGQDINCAFYIKMQFKFILFQLNVTEHIYVWQKSNTCTSLAINYPVAKTSCKNMWFSLISQSNLTFTNPHLMLLNTLF